jgi:hypothetical protein
MGLNCVNCGRELYEDRCKVRCPHCGYFEDCSDPSAPGEWVPRAEGAPGPDPESGPEGGEP